MGCQRPKSNFQQVSNRRGPSQLSNAHWGFCFKLETSCQGHNHFGSQWRCTIRRRRETLCFRAAALTGLFKEHNPFFPSSQVTLRSPAEQIGQPKCSAWNRIRGSGGSAHPPGSHPMACLTESLSTASDNLNQGRNIFFSVKRQITCTFSFAGHVVSVATAQLCCYNMKAARDNMQTNVCASPPIKLYLTKQETS